MEANRWQCRMYTPHLCSIYVCGGEGIQNNSGKLVTLLGACSSPKEGNTAGVEFQNVPVHVANDPSVMFAFF